MNNTEDEIIADECDCKENNYGRNFNCVENHFFCQNVPKNRRKNSINKKFHFCPAHSNYQPVEDCQQHIECNDPIFR